MFSGVFKYFPDALAEVANVSHVGNQQHNPGQPMAWIRHKSTDHGDCVARHLLEAGTIDSDGLRHSAKVAWRALAMLQVELEAEGKLPPVEEKIKAKMEAVLGPIDPSEFPGGSFVPLMYANTHTDAREAAAYEAERKAAAVADHVVGMKMEGAFVPLMYANTHTDAREPAVLDQLDSALKEEACVNDRLRRQCVFDEQGKRRVREDGAVAFLPEELELVEAAREPEVAEPTIPGAHSFCFTYYISGPMRNYPEFNFPAFDDAKAFLIAQGINVISPADMDREHDEDPAMAGGKPSYIYAQRDTQALIRLAEDNEKFGSQNGIYMLRGWKASKGATAEHALAEWLGLEIVYQENE